MDQGYMTAEHTGRSGAPCDQPNALRAALLLSDSCSQPAHMLCALCDCIMQVMTKWLRNQPMISDTAAELEAYAKAAKEEQGER